MSLAVLIGMAKPIPSASARIAVLMPITSPNSFTRGPLRNERAGGRAARPLHTAHAGRGLGPDAARC